MVGKLIVPGDHLGTAFDVYDRQTGIETDDQVIDWIGLDEVGSFFLLTHGRECVVFRLINVNHESIGSFVE